MPILEAPDFVKEFKSFAPSFGSLLGLDVGSKTIGLAVSDPSWLIASPLDTIRRTKFSEDAQKLANLFGERKIAGLVIGMPFNEEGNDGPRAQSTRQFARNIMKNQLFSETTRICFWDERFSTQTVETMMMKELNLSRAKRQNHKDRLAAALILQGFLDFSRDFL